MKGFPWHMLTEKEKKQRLREERNEKIFAIIAVLFVLGLAFIGIAQEIFKTVAFFHWAFGGQP